MYTPIARVDRGLAIFRAWANGEKIHTCAQKQPNPEVDLLPILTIRALAWDALARDLPRFWPPTPRFARPEDFLAPESPKVAPPPEKLKEKILSHPKVTMQDLNLLLFLYFSK